MPTAKEFKQAARELAFERRAALAPEVRQQKSQTICSDVFAYLQSCCSSSCSSTPPDTLARENTSHVQAADKAVFVAAYYEIKNEVSLETFRSLAWSAGWHVVLPCMKEPGHMEFYDIARPLVEGKVLPFLQHPARCYTDAEVEAFLEENNIDESDCHIVDPLDIDMAVLPLVAFNPETGGRLGYGGGNYDRFVPRMRADIPIVGVAFIEQRIDGLELEVHDCKAHHVFSA